MSFNGLIFFIFFFTSQAELTLKIRGAAQLTCRIFSAQPTLWFALFTHRDATLWLFKDSFCLKEKTALHTVHSFGQHNRLLSLPEGFGVQNLKIQLNSSRWSTSTDFFFFSPRIKRFSSATFTIFFERRPELQRDHRALHHHAVRHFRPCLGSGHSGRLPGVHGPAPRRLPAAVAAPVDGHAG